MGYPEPVRKVCRFTPSYPCFLPKSSPSEKDFQVTGHTGTVNRMSIDPRAALSALTTALEEHLVAASARRGEEDPIVEATFLGIIDAFEAYEEALFDAFDEVTPLVIYGEDGDEGDFDDDDDNDDDSEDDDNDDDSEDEPENSGSGTQG